MNKKGFEAEITLDETPNLIIAEEPLNTKQSSNKKVDINVLKARAQRVNDRENRKNIFIFVSILIALGIAGTYLSI